MTGSSKPSLISYRPSNRKLQRRSTMEFHDAIPSGSASVRAHVHGPGVIARNPLPGGTIT